MDGGWLEGGEMASSLCVYNHFSHPVSGFVGVCVSKVLLESCTRVVISSMEWRRFSVSLFMTTPGAEIRGG